MNFAEDLAKHDHKQYATGPTPLPELSPAGVVALLIFICSALLVLGNSFLPPQWQSKPLQWQAENGQTLKGKLCLPQHISGTLPAVLLLHGVTQDHKSMTLLGEFLAQHGFVALAVDLPEAHGAQTEIALSALHLLRSQPQVNPHQVAIVGHSMGALLAHEIASQAGAVPLSVGIGMHPEANTAARPHQLWITGLYDSLHPPWSLKPVPHRISPSANHHIETEDPGVHALLLSALNQALERQSPPKVSALNAARLYLLPWALTLLSLSSLVLLSQFWPFAPASYSGLVALSLGLGGLLAGGYFKLLPPLATAHAILIVLGGYLLAQLSPPQRRQSGRTLLGLWLALWGAREVAGLLRVSGLLWQHPQWLSHWPLESWQSLLYYPQALEAQMLKLSFKDTLMRLEPRWPLLALLMLEWIFPGWYLKALPYLKAKTQHSQHSLWLLGGCALLLLGVLVLRLQQGYLRPEVLGRLQTVMLGDILPTALLLGLMVYWQAKRQRKSQKRGFKAGRD